MEWEDNVLRVALFIRDTSEEDAIPRPQWPPPRPCWCGHHIDVHKDGGPSDGLVCTVSECKDYHPAADPDTPRERAKRSWEAWDGDELVDELKPWGED